MMTLRIGKMEELDQKRRLAVEEPITTVINQLDHPEPEVVGIPGLVRQMIGRFSCQDFDGVTNGYSHSTRSTVKPCPTASAQVKSLIKPNTTPQRISPSKITGYQNRCRVTEQNKELLHAKSDDLHSCRSLSRTKLSHSAAEVDETVATPNSTVIISDSDSSKNLSKPISAQLTVDSKMAPPLCPKSERTPRSFKMPPKNSDSSLNNCNGHKNEVDNSEIKEVSNGLSFDVQNDTNGSDGLSVAEINHTDKVSTSQSHNSSDQKTANNMHQKSTEKDGHYFLEVVSEVECGLSRHCSRLEQFLPGPITDEASGKIRAAIGKANLLITKKFQQFQDLCHKNLVHSTDEPFKTTSEDLSGFWDLVQLQVDDVQRLFNEIYELHENNWINIEPEETLTLPKVIAVKQKEKLVKSVPKKTKSSVASEVSKSRDEARKRLLAAKMAQRQRKASETEDDIQIFIS